MRHLDLALLQTFVAIADHGSFTQAAKQVHRTQSAVSLQMQRLEAAAGAPLFQEERPSDGDDGYRRSAA